MLWWRLLLGNVKPTQALEFCIIWDIFCAWLTALFDICYFQANLWYLRVMLGSNFALLIHGIFSVHHKNTCSESRWLVSLMSVFIGYICLPLTSWLGTGGPLGSHIMRQCSVYCIVQGVRYVRILRASLTPLSHWSPSVSYRGYIKLHY